MQDTLLNLLDLCYQSKTSEQTQKCTYVVLQILLLLRTFQDFRRTFTFTLTSRTSKIWYFYFYSYFRESKIWYFYFYSYFRKSKIWYFYFYSYFRHIKNLILLLLLVLRVFEIFVLLFLKYHVIGPIWSQLNMQPLGGSYVDMSGWMEFQTY